MAVAWPSGFIPNRARWVPRTHSSVTESLFTRTAVTYELAGSRWECTLEFDRLSEARWRDLSGFLSGLYGATGRVLLPAFDYSAARGNAAGTLTATGSLFAKAITISGFAGSNPVLRRGDRLTVGGTRMHEVTTDVAAAGGAAVVPVFPPLRASYTGEPVEVAAPVCEMRLASDEETGREIEPPYRASYVISFVEALP